MNGSENDKCCEQWSVGALFSVNERCDSNNEREVEFRSRH